MTEKIKEILAEQLRIDKESISDETNITEDLGADSLDIVELLMAIEENFGIEIPDGDVANLKTVKSIAEYIESKQ